MRVSPSAAALLLISFLPGLSFGLALGDIELNSALNEPLEAQIEVLAATPQELGDLTARIAPRETFERYGLERPDFLSGLYFTVTSDGGRNLLQVRSRQPIAEPFVTFLVEAQWRRGRLLREYTVLLDPPVFMPVPETAKQAPAPIAAPRGVVAQPAPAAGYVERPPPRRPAPRRTASGPASYGTDYGPIRRGETLWGIAERLRSGSSLTMNQIMVAIYQANPEAFLGNINLVKEGSVLRIPDSSTIASTSQERAFATAVAHNEAWRAGRPSQLAQAAVRPSVATAAQSESPRLRLVEPETGTGTAASGTGGETDAALAATNARNEAELSRLGQENQQLRDDLEEVRRLINLKDSELAQLQRQAAAGIETPPAISPDLSPADVSDGVDGTATDVALPAGAEVAGLAPAVDPADPTDAAREPVAGDPTAAGDATDVITDGVVTGQSESGQADERAAPIPVVTTSADTPGLVTTVLDAGKSLLSSLWLWIGLGIVALAAFAAMFIRNRSTTEPDMLEALAGVPDTDETAIILRPKLPAAEDADVEFFDDSGTFKPVDFAAAQTADVGESGNYPFEDTVGATGEIKLDQSDPLAEADFHLAYGLYDQAADLVGKAVERQPDRVDLRMKLLEIFFVGGNADQFKASAADLKQNMFQEIAGEWDKIVIMGKQICPDDELFSGDAGIGSGADIDLEFDSSDAASVDFDTSDTTGATSAVNLDMGDVFSAADDTADSMASFADAADNTAEEVAGFSSDMSDDDDGLDFDLGLEMADPLVEDETSPAEPVADIKDQIKARLSSTDNDETAEMDLSDLGVDLDLGGMDADADAGFNDVFSAGDAEPTSEMPAATAELTAAGQGLDLDIGDMFGADDSDAEADDDEETARDLNTLEESMEATTPPGEGTGHFSAEIETLHGDALDIDIGRAEMDVTRLIEGDEPTGSHNEDAFSASVFGDQDADNSNEVSASVGGLEDETKMLGPKDTPQVDDLAGVFGGDEETVLTEGLTEGRTGEHDGLATDVFGLETGLQSLDLDIGDAMEPISEDVTTEKVATADMALPDVESELSEVGTKLDLARAYMDMGDPDGARGILEEVMAEGDANQKADARQLLEDLS